MPASKEFVAEYAAYLARRLKPSSVKQYLNVVRLIHDEVNCDNPCADNWILKSTLIGINRLKGSPVMRKAPVTPQLLMEMYKHLDLTQLVNVMFWAGAMVMFFGTFRKSNLFPVSRDKFCPQKQFVRSDFIACHDGTILLNVRYSKTIQFRQRAYKIALFPTHHILCLVKAIKLSLTMFKGSESSPAFVINQAGEPMCGSMFNRMFKSLVQRCGRDPAVYSSHSFRRGSATWALQCGIPGEIIQQMGDWKSMCYKDYLDQVSVSVHDDYRKLFISRLP